MHTHARARTQLTLLPVFLAVLQARDASVHCLVKVPTTSSGVSRPSTYDVSVIAHARQRTSNAERNRGWNLRVEPAGVP